MEYLLSVVIPCYNSQEYMRRAVDSALAGGEVTEVIIVNDGSKDATADIAKEYADRYGNIVAINKENGGHGDAVMTGIRAASGKYVRVLDSDDLFDEESLQSLLHVIRINDGVDLFITNYSYEKVDAKPWSVSYGSALPKDTVFGWDDTRKFPFNKYLLMHSLTYRRSLLIECGLELPKHTFYVDNIYAYYPLPYVKTMFYRDVNLYRYQIGREDQSVNEKIMIGRIDQQISVTEKMTAFYHLPDIENVRLRKYMAGYLTIMYTVCSSLLVEAGDEESLKKKDELWAKLETKDKDTFEYVHKKFLGWATSKHGYLWNRVIHHGYKISQVLFRFN